MAPKGRTDGMPAILHRADGTSQKTITIALAPEIDRALEVIAAKRGWTKKAVVAWALAGRAEVRMEMEQNGGKRK